jgi:glycosyltransferase involved in cell wall biosynthesis
VPSAAAGTVGESGDGLTSIVLPIHDQAEYIGGIVEDYLPVLARLRRPYEVLLVTNGCTDHSVAVCQQLAAAHPPVEHFDVTRGGWGRAVKAGLRTARGDLLCYTNSARTQPEMLALLLSYAAAYPGVVLKANRRVRDSWRRRAGSLLYNLECRALFDLAAWDINGTPKVFPRSFSRLLALRRDDDLIDAEFNWVCKREGYPLVEVPILATTRRGGKSTTNYASAARMYLGAYRMRRSGP